MTAYLLDTCTISDFFNGIGRTEQRLKALQPIQLSISSVTAMEVYYGLALKPSAKKKYIKVFQSFCQVVAVIHFDEEMAKVAADIRALLKAKGKTIGPWDLLIGATALTCGYTLVTSNEKEFERIIDLKIENWR